MNGLLLLDRDKNAIDLRFFDGSRHLLCLSCATIALKKVEEEPMPSEPREQFRDAYLITVFASVCY